MVTAGRNINNLRYAGDITLMAESTHTGIGSRNPLQISYTYIIYGIQRIYIIHVI